MQHFKNESISKSKWEKFLQENEHASPFQSFSFYDLFNSVPGLSANVYAIENNNKIEALCVVTMQKEKGIKGYFSRRAIIYGGPLLSSDDKEVNAKLINEITNDLKSEVIYIETRNFSDYSFAKDDFVENGWKYESYLNFHLNCSSEEIVNSNLNSNRTRQIKKAFKSGVLLEEAKTPEEVEKYYSILKDLYSKKIKKPLLPFEFFKLFFEKEIGKILLVKIENKIIGGIVSPILKNNSIYEFYICGLDQEYKDFSPGVMATYAAIQYGFKNNLKKFDFMGAGKPNEDYGVRDFKAKFGGELKEHGRFIKINNQFLFSLGKFALSVIKRK
ncbi:MAG TPA: peptidoglycan bridge formation glycyltransferase FemA/FemB family protein [Bacteroidia bacterium]|jgi:serine/alanine adding enzyme|nr:peptidoglycan bridge formation glycyltransferase FemA/FemB family protein [Bacteroidia bacterium]